MNTTNLKGDAVTELQALRTQVNELQAQANKLELELRAKKNKNRELFAKIVDGIKNGTYVLTDENIDLFVEVCKEYSVACID